MRTCIFATLLVFSVIGNARADAYEQAMLDGRVSILSFECSQLAWKDEDKKRLHATGMERGRAFLEYAKMNGEKVYNTAQNDYGGLEWGMAADSTGTNLKTVNIDYVLGFIRAWTKAKLIHSYQFDSYKARYRTRNCDLIGR